MRLWLILGGIALVAAVVLLMRRKASAAGGGQAIPPGPHMQPGDTIGGVTVGERAPKAGVPGVTFSTEGGVVTSVAVCNDPAGCFGTKQGAVEWMVEAAKRELGAPAAAPPGKPAPITSPTVSKPSSSSGAGSNKFGSLCRAAGIC